MPAEHDLRVVSLVPSATETLLAWGIRPVGVTRFCPQAGSGENGLPALGGTKDPHVDEIVALRPDLVVMCDQENRKEDAEHLASAGLQVLAVHITAIDEVASEMARLAQAVGRDPELGWACAPDASQGASSDSTTKAHSSGSRTKVFVPIWKRPWMTITADTFAGSLLASIGCDSVAVGSNRYPELSLEEAVELGTQLVLAPSEPYPFAERHRATLETVAPTLFVDGQDLFWWGWRTPQAVRRLRSTVELGIGSAERDGLA